MRKIRIFALLLALAMVAAACGTDDDTGSGDTEATTSEAKSESTEATDAPTATEAKTESTEAMDEPPEAGPLGQVVIAPGQSIEIRSLNVLTGANATLGIPNQRGVELAIADFGQVAGHDVNLGTGLDDLCSAEGGQAGAQTIVSDPQVIGVIGTSCSGAAASASPLISAAGLVMISPSNTSPSLTSDLEGNVNPNYQPGYYRTAHNDLFQGRAVADFLFNTLGLTTAAAIHDGDPYTDGLATAFSDAFELLGGEIVVYTAVSVGDVDMVPVLTEVAAGAPQALFFPIFIAEGQFLAQQVAGIAGLEDTVLISADALISPAFMELPEAEGIYHSGPDLGYGSNTNSHTGQDATGFLADYTAAYGEDPSAPFWAHSYDATTMLLTAIATVGVDIDGTLYVDRQDLRDELNATSFNGIIGAISCDAFGDCGAQKITIVLNNDTSDFAVSSSNVVYSFAP